MLQKSEIIRFKEVLGPPGSKVMTLRSLARTLNMSPLKIHAIIRHLVKQKTLVETGGLRKRYYVDEIPFAGVGNNKKNRLFECLQNDILHGNLKLNPGNKLPTMKSLALRYGCSPATIRKQMQALCDEGLCFPRGSSYGIRGQPRQSNSTVYFLGKPNITWTKGNDNLNILKDLERKLLQNGYNPPNYLLTSESIPMKLPADHTVASYVIFWNRENKNLVELLKKTSQTPLIILDRSGHSEVKAYKKNWFVIQNSNHISGKNTASALATRGHRRIALFTSQPKREFWERERLRGIVQMYPGKKGEFSHEIFPLTLTSARVDLVEDYLKILNPKYHVTFVNSSVLPLEAVRNLVTAIETTNHMLVSREAVIPQFTKAYKDHSFDAWVCMNDEIAILAKHFLNIQKDKTRKPNVYGFDNLPLSYAMGISSYDFDINAMSSLAMEAILQPQQILRAYGNHMVVEGQMVLR